MVEDFDNEIREIKLEAAKLAWYMRGGLDLTDAYNLSADDRKVISSLIDENLETTKKTNLPFF